MVLIIFAVHVMLCVRRLELYFVARGFGWTPLPERRPLHGTGARIRARSTSVVCAPSLSVAAGRKMHVSIASLARDLTCLTGEGSVGSWANPTKLSVSVSNRHFGVVCEVGTSPGCPSPPHSLSPPAGTVPRVCAIAAPAASIRPAAVGASSAHSVVAALVSCRWFIRRSRLHWARSVL